MTSQAILGLHRRSRAKTSGSIFLDGEDLMTVSNERLRNLRGTDVVVLACTHYPLLKAVIQKVMGKGVTLVDSATETARAARFDTPLDGVFANVRDAEGFERDTALSRRLGDRPVCRYDARGRYRWLGVGY